MVSLFDAVLKFEDRYFKSLPFNLSKLIVDRGELLFYSRFWNEPETSFKVAFIFLLLA